MGSRPTPPRSASARRCLRRGGADRRPRRHADIDAGMAGLPGAALAERRRDRPVDRPDQLPAAVDRPGGERRRAVGHGERRSGSSAPRRAGRRACPRARGAPLADRAEPARPAPLGRSRGVALADELARAPARPRRAGGAPAR